MRLPVNPGGRIVDMLRSCYETWMRFPGLSSEWIKIRWVFVDGETKSVPPTVYSSLNWEPPERHAGERKGLSRKWVDGSKPPVAFDAFFGSDEAWLGNTDADSPMSVPSQAFKCPPPPPPEDIAPPPIAGGFADPGGGRGWSGSFFYGVPTLTGVFSSVVAIYFRMQEGSDPRRVRIRFEQHEINEPLKIVDFVDGQTRLLIYERSGVPGGGSGVGSFGITDVIPGGIEAFDIGALDARAISFKGPVQMGSVDPASGVGWTHRPRCGPVVTTQKARAYLAVVAGGMGNTTYGPWQNGFTRVGNVDTRLGVHIDLAVKLVWREPASGMIAERWDQGAQRWLTALLPIDGPWVP